MRKAGYEVFIARNGSEAMEILEANTPSLVVLDIMMPDIDGYQICRHIRSTDHLRDTKVIFIRAKTKGVDIAKGLSVGADDYLTKLFSTRMLTNRIQRMTQYKIIEHGASDQDSRRIQRTIPALYRKARRLLGRDSRSFHLA